MKKTIIIMLMIIFITALLAVPVLSPEDDKTEDKTEEQEIDYAQPETITADNFDKVDGSKLDADKLERSGISAEEIKEKATTEQADAYRTKNQPLPNAGQVLTSKEAAFLSKCSNLENVDTDSLVGIENAGITENSVSIGSATVNLGPGVTSLTTNENGNLVVNEDIIVKSGNVYVHGNGHITVGENSHMEIGGADITSVRAMDYFDLSQAQPSTDMENFIAYSEDSLMVSVSSNNHVTIDKASGSPFTDIYVQPINDGSSVMFTENHADDSRSIVKFTVKGATYQNRAGLDTKIIENLPDIYGEHTTYVTKGNSYYCTDCRQVGDDITPENIHIQNRLGQMIRYTVKDIQCKDNYNVVNYLGSDGSRIYSVQYSKFDSDDNVIKTETRIFNEIDYDNVKNSLRDYYNAVDHLKQAPNTYTQLPTGGYGNLRKFYSEITVESLAYLDETIEKSYDIGKDKVGEEKYTTYRTAVEERRQQEEEETFARRLQAASQIPTPVPSPLTTTSKYPASGTTYDGSYGKPNTKAPWRIEGTKGWYDDGVRMYKVIMKGGEWVHI